MSHNSVSLHQNFSRLDRRGILISSLEWTQLVVSTYTVIAINFSFFTAVY